MAGQTVAKPKKARDVGRQRENTPNTGTYAGRVAARIIQLREKRGWNATELVDKLEAAGFSTSKPTLYKYESGKLSIPVESVPCFARAFGLTVCEFLPKR